MNSVLVVRQVEGLRRETDRASVDRRRALEEEIADKEKEMAALNDRWAAEKAALAGVKGAKERLEASRRDLEAAQVCSGVRRRMSSMSSVVLRVAAAVGGGVSVSVSCECEL